MDPDRKTNIIGGFLKGLKVIESFDSDRQRQSIADISRTTGLDRATCRRLLLTLVHAGYAAQDGRTFWLTPRTLQLGYAYLHSAALPDLLQGFLEKLAADIGESCSASVMDGTQIFYIARASFQRVMSINLRVGSHLPVYCSSMGRVLLASLPDDEVQRRLEMSDLVKLTAKTCTDIPQLMQEIGRIRLQDYAIVDEELEVGVRSIAVPVRNKMGVIVAAVNVGTNAARVQLEELTSVYLPKMILLQGQLAQAVT